MKAIPLHWYAVSVLALSTTGHAEPPVGIEKRVLARTLTVDETRQRQLTLLSVQASQASYKLPDLRVFKDLDDYVSDFRAFQATIPPGYVVYGADGEIESGLKFVIFKPATSGDPWILAITGTKGLIDCLSDVRLGGDQFEALKKMILMFSELPQLSNVELLVTGHSLGGGLAQAAAHEIRRKRNAKSNPARVILRTWNAFGAQELISRACGDCDALLLEQMDAANFFVRGDKVSRIGTHFGPTYELIALETSSVQNELEKLGYFHALNTIDDHVKKIIQTQPLVVEPVAIVKEGSLNMIASVAGLCGTLGIRGIHWARQLRIVQQQLAILSLVKASDFQDPVRADALRYLYNVGVREHKQLARSKDADRNQYAVVLEAQLKRIQPLLHNP